MIDYRYACGALIVAVVFLVIVLAVSLCRAAAKDEPKPKGGRE